MTSLQSPAIDSYSASSHAIGRAVYGKGARIREPVDAMLHEDLDAPPENRHTIRRICQRLLDEHDVHASYSTVRSYVLH
ncbi:hypothetical protein F0L68_40730 [Solihabitans fulvus]|uniref:Uncharacterized protein n=1 Tax=Solihabitans fulvus TaxID=1892852 RepID=A0A5B2W7Z9_9PSEU|nr:hypothetical protein [Solihabitans fulvus]KAA2246359.1 hypothetical protein F0L68_40730 [Solihabitans fulvus]